MTIAHQNVTNGRTPRVSHVRRIGSPMPALRTDFSVGVARMSAQEQRTAKMLAKFADRDGAIRARLAARPCDEPYQFARATLARVADLSTYERRVARRATILASIMARIAAQ